MERNYKTKPSTLAEKIKDRQETRARLIELPKVTDRRGNLSFVEARDHVPFNIARAYWIYDVPGGQRRGSHAFRQQQEMIIALSGSFDVLLDDGNGKTKYTLNRSYHGLYVPNMTWRSLENFSTNSVCLVISSDAYDEGDYIRNYKIFKEEAQRSKNTLIDKKQEFDRKIDANIPQYNTVFDCSLIEFPVVRNRGGNITAVHESDNIPFDIARVFYIYDIPSDAKRGMHAHRCCHEILVATSGSFDVELDDGTNKRTVTLNKPMYGLHIPPGVWATEKEYSSGAICLALASDKYETDDYINTYSDFKKYRRSENRDI